MESLHDDEAALTGHELTDPNAPLTDPYFDRQWGIAIMERGLKTLESMFRDSGKAEQFEVLKPWLVGETENLSQADAAKQLGLTTGAIKVAIHRLRKEFGAAIKTEIEQTVDHPEEVAEELRYLIEVMSLG